MTTDFGLMDMLFSCIGVVFLWLVLVRGSGKHDGDPGCLVSATVPSGAVTAAALMFVLAMLFEHGLVAEFAGFQVFQLALDGFG
jgi:hypothetical protein